MYVKSRVMREKYQQDIRWPRLINARMEQMIFHQVWANGRAIVAQINQGERMNVPQYTLYPCCVWGCISIGQSEYPYWPMFIAKSIRNIYTSARTEICINRKG